MDMIAASKVVRGTATSLCACAREKGQVSGVVMPQAVSRSESAMFTCRSLGIAPDDRTPPSISVWMKALYMWRHYNIAL